MAYSPRLRTGYLVPVVVREDAARNHRGNNESDPLSRAALGLVASRGFEPLKAKPSDLQSDPFGRLGNLPGAFGHMWSSDRTRGTRIQAAATPGDQRQPGRIGCRDKGARLAPIGAHL